MKLLPTENVPGEFTFFCEGCNMHHVIWTQPIHGQTAVWKFNGNVDKPTFSPSLLVRYGNSKVCHSYITNGEIQYLSDCTHPLAGKTVELKDWQL